MKVSEVIKLLEKDGWFEVTQNGSHKQFKHDLKKKRVTVSYHKKSDELDIGTLKSIERQSGIKLKK